jgi:uncharacterized protein UPF0489
MKYPDIDAFDTDDSYFEEIQSNVWLMDDHRWSYYIWERFATCDAEKVCRTLVHLDYHYDGINDLQQVEDQEHLRRIRELNDIYRIVSDSNSIQKDSFIAPAIIRGIIDDAHFYCFQRDTTPE